MLCFLQAAAGAGASSDTADAPETSLLINSSQPPQQAYLHERLATADAELAEHMSCAALYLQLLQVKLTAVQAKRDAQHHSKAVPKDLGERLRQREKDVRKCSALSGGLEALCRALD